MPPAGHRRNMQRADPLELAANFNREKSSSRNHAERAANQGSERFVEGRLSLQNSGPSGGPQSNRGHFGASCKQSPKNRPLAPGGSSAFGEPTPRCQRWATSEEA